ncbi:MAG TPA: Crp/Fnr family transcriptional regulator [Gammaproteobacteria bacterium]
MPSTPGFFENRILAALTPAERARLTPALEPVTLTQDDVMYEPGGAIHYAYFPVDMIVSLLHVFEDGASAEFAIVGNDGMIGVPLVTGGGTMPFRSLVQSTGMALRMKSAAFTNEFQRNEGLHDAVLRYMQALLVQMAQTAVCNRHHTVDRQLCRWLLLSLDRVPSRTLTMTQELIAGNLGVRREGVTIAARKLQKLGAIDYARGHITVLDRGKLEASSCECYAVMRSETDRLLPLRAARRRRQV